MNPTRFSATLGILLWAAAALLTAGELKQPMIGESAPPVRLQTLDGKTLDFSDLRGKFVVLHFGTGW